MPTPNARPNLLHVVTDQQRFDTIHAAGNPHIFTPHLNWLMDTGTIFRRAYCDGPSCVPARASMITGTPLYLQPVGFGNWGQPTAPDPRRTLPGLLTAGGYQTRAIGKLHYNPTRCHYGFEHAEILEDYYREHQRRGGPQPKRHGVGENEMEPAISTVHETESLTTWTAERAVNFLETRDTTRPFYLQLGFTKPHPPFDPPLNYWQLYQGLAMPDATLGDWSREIADVPQGFMRSTYGLSMAQRFTPEQWRQIRRAYYACITQIDYNLGLLFARLRELGLLENTLIVFHSDHGEMLGDHHMAAKTVFFEGAAHIPMLARWPSEVKAFAALQGGTKCDDIVTLADLMPTFLAAAGVARPAEMPKSSANLADVARGKVAARPFVGAYEQYFALIEGDWKYHFTALGGDELLFNLAADPMETKNLAAQHPDLCRDFNAKLAKTLGPHRRIGLKRGAKRLPVRAPAKDALKAKVQRWPGFHHPDHTAEDLLH